MFEARTLTGGICATLCQHTARAGRKSRRDEGTPSGLAAAIARWMILLGGFREMNNGVASMSAGAVFARDAVGCYRVFALLT